MDGQRFDAITKRVAVTSSRRQILRGLVGVVVAGTAGLFQVKEAVAAPHWGDFSYGDCCGFWDDQSGRGYRTYSAILWGIPWGQSWEETCAVTPADFTDKHGTPQHFDRPTWCENNFWNEWGHFHVWDATCDGGPHCLTVRGDW